MLCPNCNTNEAVTHHTYGVLPCVSCQNKRHNAPGSKVELIPERMKEDRKAHLQDILPPSRFGELSKEWVDKYGADKARQRGFSEREIQNAKNVWRSETYYSRE